MTGFLKKYNLIKSFFITSVILVISVFSNIHANPITKERKQGALGAYKPEYKTPESFKVWKSRYPFPMAFSYNLANPNFNASIIKMVGYTFLAIEAPSELNKGGFYELIDENNLGCFVKLNTPEEYPQENYLPYWNGGISCKLFSYSWPHRQGADEKTLLQLVKDVCASKPQGIIGVS